MITSFRCPNSLKNLFLIIVSRFEEIGFDLVDPSEDPKTVKLSFSKLAWVFWTKLGQNSIPRILTKHRHGVKDPELECIFIENPELYLDQAPRVRSLQAL